MKDILFYQHYLERMLEASRPGVEHILAFYDHRVGSICKDARLLLVPLDDHLCHRGDGIFESISYRYGHMFSLDAHMERMCQSAAGLKLTPPCSWEEVRSTILDVARAGGEENGSVRVLLGRGPGGFGLSPAECPEASLYIVALRSNSFPPEYYAKGISACRSAIPAKQAYLAQIKNVNYLPNVLMSEEALQKKVGMTFSFTEEGFLAEAAMANVGIVTQNDILVCPPFTHTLAGTTLLLAHKIVEKMLQKKRAEKTSYGVVRRQYLQDCKFENIREEDIFEAKEVLIFGSSPLCVGVTSYEGIPIGDGHPGLVAHMLRRLLMKELLAGGVGIF